MDLSTDTIFLLKQKMYPIDHLILYSGTTMKTMKIHIQRKMMKPVFLELTYSFYTLYHQMMLKMHALYFSQSK